MNVGEWIFKRALTHPARAFLKEGDRVFDNRRFNERVNATAGALMDLGIKKGDRVAVLMINCSELLEVFFACAKTGAVMVPLNFKLALPELHHIIGDCRPRALIYSSLFGKTAAALKAAHGSIAHALAHGPAAPGPDPLLAAVTASFAATEPTVEPVVTLADPLMIVYTSGTTGAPKGAVLSHQNVLFGAIHSLVGYGIGAGCKSLVIAPLFHVGALAASVTPVVYAGGSLVLGGFDNPSETVQTIADEKINYMFAVPVMYEIMTKAATWPATDFSHVHFFISGGAPMNVALIRKYQDEKGVRFAQGYAMTETLRLTSLDLDDAIAKAGSVGKEVFHTRLRIVDENGADAAPEAVGEIVVKGPTVFSGYWNRPEETAAAFRNGWFHTGDLAWRDPDGFLYIVGRKTDMIIRSGENIYAVEVEQAIAAVAGVAEAAVVGMPDPKRGEVVAAFVLRKQGAALSENGLIEALQGRIAYYKIPKKVVFVNDFPRNSAGKILKRELKKQLPGCS
jgi:fatty-acyl-CoA synthase